jgi:menaquinone-dependent protoporphyrinogen IX oxidase
MTDRQLVKSVFTDAHYEYKYENFLEKHKIIINRDGAKYVFAISLFSRKSAWKYARKYIEFELMEKLNDR